MLSATYHTSPSREAMLLSYHDTAGPTNESHWTASGGAVGILTNLIPNNEDIDFGFLLLAFRWGIASSTKWYAQLILASWLRSTR